jgi:hypothetical protein
MRVSPATREGQLHSLLVLDDNGVTRFSSPDCAPPDYSRVIKVPAETVR